MPVLQELTIGQLLAQTVARFPNRPAVEYKGGVVSYSMLDMLTDDIARGFQERGIEKGNHVGIWGNDRPNTLYCYLALQKLGAVTIMLGTSLKKQEITSLLEQTDVEYLIFDEGFKEVSFPEVCRELRLPKLRELIYIGSKPEPGFFSMDNLMYSSNFAPQEMLEIAKNKVLPSDTDVILFTSGTTGSAKGVVTTHYSRSNNTLSHIKALCADENDKFCIAIPMFHCFSLTAGVLTALAAGSCIYFPTDRHTHTILNAIANDRCTILHAVPTLFSALISRDDIESYDLASLRTGFIGGSIYTPEFFSRVSSKLHFNLLPSLGQTEATGGFTFTDHDAAMDVKENTVGTFSDHIQGAIRDIVSTQTLENGVTGEICIRGYNVMKGYYKNPKLTETVLSQDGWLRTGDLGYQDESGNIHITGRLKELIIRGGENIAPGEIEDIIAADPRIDSVKVIGVPDPHYGEEICACIVLNEGESISDVELKANISNQLANYKVPKYILYFNEMPRTFGGKIALGKLREQARIKLGLMINDYVN